MKLQYQSKRDTLNQKKQIKNRIVQKQGEINRKKNKNANQKYSIILNQINLAIENNVLIYLNVLCKSVRNHIPSLQ